MEYPYLTFLWIMKLILTLFLGTGAVYYLLKLLKQQTKFLIVLKGIVFYEICAVLIHLIFSKFYTTNGFYTGGIVGFLILAIILFVVFYFITRRYFLINLKKALIVFFVMIFTSSLFLGLFGMIEPTLWSVPPFVSDRVELDKQIDKIIAERGYGGYFFDPLFFGVQYQPLSFRILTNVETGAFTWFLEYIRTALVNK